VMFSFWFGLDWLLYELGDLMKVTIELLIP